jgi:hypothetical protein
MGFLVVKWTVLEGDTVMCSSDISYNDDHNHNNYDYLKLTLMFSHTHTHTYIHTYTYTYTFTDPSSTQARLSAEFFMERDELQYATKSKQ